MAHYRQVGAIPPKRHTQFRGRAGSLYYEELMGEEGFSSDSSLLYHREIPSAIVDSAVWDLPSQVTVPNSPLEPRHFVLPTLFADADPGHIDVVTGRRLLLGNSDVRMSYVVAQQDSPLYRSALGDELVFVQAGSTRLETVFGAMDIAAGDYVLIPRGTTHRWLSGPEPLRAFVIEATGHIVPPKRYLSRFGQFLEHAPYCERDLRAPADILLAAGRDVDVLVKHRGAGGAAGTRMTYAHHPFDVVGWDGCLYPFVFNIADFEPITGRLHQPPPAHQVFEGDGFVVCNFVPRKVDYHPAAIPVPYYHSNVDSDEVMFYVDGDYAARAGTRIDRGSVSLHPGGHAHGPHPGSYENSIGTEFVDETAVMVDTFRPLELGEAALACTDDTYAWSWSESGARR
ncbi:homogentisate 1,2-dioxygenase [Nocardia cyriacigeorgica]|uniref:homogentisate 1,2-dioxygenase n=1 Tax=Nocardia cyriacigeorgica TaxID=135487 RepID=UPI0024555E00|nr:homogentisate 1,2-dioxygenase [Nocardia cyriacigeorgica]